MNDAPGSIGPKHLLSFGAMGFGVIGALLTILSYVIFAPSLASMHSAADAQFDGMDGMLAAAEKISANLSATASAAPAGALADMNDALLSYASSSDSLAGTLESASGMFSLVGVTGVSKAAEDLHSSARSMRAASLKVEELKSSANSTVEGLFLMSAQLSESRSQLSDLRTQTGSALSALQAAHAITTLAILAGFACLIALSAANLFDKY